MFRLISVLGLCVAFMSTASTAEARHRRHHHHHHHHHHHRVLHQDYQPESLFGFDFFQGTIQPTIRHASTILGGRPHGCPHRFCGCGVSLKTFGRIIPELNLAANWGRKFHSTSRREDVVAWRPGHVLYVMHHTTGSKYMVYDPNSGHGRIRIHERDLSRFRFVDYHSPRRA